MDRCIFFCWRIYQGVFDKLKLKSVATTTDKNRESPSTSEYQREDINAQRIQNIPLDTYLSKLKASVNSWCKEDDHEGNSMGAKALVISLIYLRRLKKSNRDLVFDDTNIRNLFLISVMLATKFLDDWVIPTKYWAKLVVCDVEQIVNMEATFCHEVGFNFTVSRQQIRHAVITLERRVF